VTEIEMLRILIVFGAATIAGFLVLVLSWPR
jgi:hypothetical protein